MRSFHELSGLKGFGYYDIENSLKIRIENTPNYFNDEIFKKEKWCGKPIRKVLADAKDAEYDSGVICAKESEFSVDEEGRVKALNCFVAPYQLMRNTIGELCDRIERDNEPVAFSKAKELRPNDGIAVAIGMVLAVIAVKGSAEKRNRTPYIVLTRRQNVRIRNNELDAAAVEGLNYGDFYKEKGMYVASLGKIAQRALEEERGLNCNMLESRGLLHMPKKYYLGYDEQYHQWNFFGTVVVDCTVEEIIREGCYFTKDKFESRAL